MATSQRAFDRGRRRGDRLVGTLGNELRDARLSYGLSHQALAAAVRMPASKISRVERAALPSLSVRDAALIATAVGLDLSVKTFPGGAPIRDSAHAHHLQRLLHHISRPLRYRTEVPLPARDGFPDLRSWDATITDQTEEMGVEVEMKLHDAQAQTRRIHLKWRDGGVARLLVVVADTKGNRRVITEFEQYFAQLPRLRTSRVLSSLAAGHLPPTGMILL